MPLSNSNAGVTHSFTRKGLTSREQERLDMLRITVEVDDDGKVFPKDTIEAKGGHDITSAFPTATPQ